jgi:DNA repair and recombination protein RAD52
MLATKPLKGELMTRKGPANRNLTYLSGDSVTRTLNDIFGFDGWCLEVKETRREVCEKDERQRHCVAYTALVRVTHRQSGAFKEDCGAGDSTDKSLATAVNHALKSSVTDALKRAVRHFGDKLGNSLYDGSFNINKAPRTLQDALKQYEIDRAKSKFGFKKDRAKDNTQHPKGQQEKKLAGNNASNDANLSIAAHSLGSANSPVPHSLASNPSVAATPVTKTCGMRYAPSSAQHSSIKSTSVIEVKNPHATSIVSIANGSRPISAQTSSANGSMINRYNSNSTPASNDTLLENSGTNSKTHNSAQLACPNTTTNGLTSTSIISAQKPLGSISTSNGFSKVNNAYATPNGLNRFQRNPTNATSHQLQYRSNNACSTSTTIGSAIPPAANVNAPSFATGARPNQCTSIARQHQPKTAIEIASSRQDVSALMDITASRTANLGTGINTQNLNGKRSMNGDEIPRGSVAKKMVPYNGTNPYLNSRK